ncbi:MAG: SPOR domain-containing protein [Candidatus Competibacteraceae bacterium]|jgi:DamX protein
MNALSWKALLLLILTLLVALGLQAASIKIMINLSQPSEPAVPAETRTAPVKPRPLATTGEVERPLAPLSEERIAANPAPTAHEPNPEAGLMAPPPVNPPAKPDPQSASSNPEARQFPVTAPPPHPAVAPNPPPVTPSAEAHSPPPAPSTPAPAAVVTPTAPVAPTATPSPEANPAPVAGGLYEVAWLKARDPRRYTVQIYSGKDLSALREISVAVATTDPQAYFTTTSRSGPWHSLVVGDYPDSAAAQAAIAKITARVPATKPWIRRFDEVQAKLR